MSRNAIETFCNSLESLDLKGAALFVEEAAKELIKLKEVTPSSLERLSEILGREVEDEIDLLELRSEVLKLNVPYLSECISNAIKKLKPDDERIIKLRKLIEALINFYKYYSSSGTEQD